MPTPIKRKTDARLPPKFPAMIYVGIDPGNKGGIAAVNHRGKVVMVEPMPHTELELTLLLQEMDDCWKDKRVCVENIRANLKQRMARNAAITFGMGFGYIRGCLSMMHAPVEYPPAQEWQKGLKIPPRKKTENRGQWKKRLKVRAQQLFPDLEVWKSTQGEQLAVADALLIAEYYRRRCQGCL